jgi:glucose-6-phosphate-specific signal transduction histidine kinase
MLKDNSFDADKFTIIKAYDVMLEKQANSIAKELHDEIGQTLTALKYKLSLLILQNNTNQIFTANAEDLLVLTDLCMQNVYGLIDKLQSVNIEFGLVKALERLCQVISQKCLLICRFTSQCDSGIPDKPGNRIIYGVLEEILWQIAKNISSTSKTIAVNIRQTAESPVVIEICTDSALSELSLSAQEWDFAGKYLKVLGGYLDISAEKQQNFKMIMVIPLAGFVQQFS